MYNYVNIGVINTMPGCHSLTLSSWKTSAAAAGHDPPRLRDLGLPKPKLSGVARQSKNSIWLKCNVLTFISIKFEDKF